MPQHHRIHDGTRNLHPVHRRRQIPPAPSASAQSTTTAPIPISATESAVYTSPDPERVWAYSPGLALLPSGRLVATMDQGGDGVKELPGIKTDAEGCLWDGKIYTSDDHGKTWQHLKGIFSESSSI